MTYDDMSVLIESSLSTPELTEEGVKEILMKLEYERIINSHKFSEKPDKEGYYRVYVKDATVPSGRKQFRDRNLDNLKQKVYNFVKCVPDSSNTVSFKDAFEYAQKFELNNVSPERQFSKNNTISKNKSDYKRFFSGSSFENKNIRDITLRDIDLEVRSILKRLSLSKKGMASIRGIINMTFKRSLYMGWIASNPAERIIWKDYAKLLVEPVSIAERSYTDEELIAMHNYVLERHTQQPDYIPAYALEFQMLVGMRRGEIAPLLWDDVDFENRTIFVHRELISQQNKRAKAEQICNYTKNGKSRYYPIADLEMEFLLRLKQIDEQYYPNSPFLFPSDTPNGCITNNMVYQFFRRMCIKLGIEISHKCIRGTHALRRNAITEAVNNSNGNFVLTAQMFGNSPETIRKHYYTGECLDELREVLGKRKLFVQDEQTSSSSKSDVSSSRIFRIKNPENALKSAPSGL